MNTRPGFLLLTPEDGARVMTALSESPDPDLRAIAARLKESGARASQAKARPTGRRAAELWDTYCALRAAAPVASVAAFLASERDPFPGTEGGIPANGRATKEQMEDRVEVAAFCILAQPNGLTSDVRALLAQRWGVGDVQVSNIFKRAAERLRGQARPDDDLRAKVVAHGWNVYDAALRAKRPQAAVGALDGIARNAGLIKSGVEVNVYESPQFIEATTRIVDTFHSALEVPAVAAALPDVDRAVIERVLNAARAAVDSRMTSLAKPMLEAGAD